MKKSFIMAVLITASIALFAGNQGNIIPLKGESLIFPRLYWLFMIPLAIVIGYVFKVGIFGKKAKDKV
ncbi:MAG: hypothetical protein ABIQ11_00370 [Saprospiraceae bacterium]